MGDCQSVQQEGDEFEAVKKDKEYVKVQIPDGAVAGSLIKFRTPGGRLIQASIPDGYGPGDQITVEVPTKRLVPRKTSSKLCMRRLSTLILKTLDTSRTWRNLQKLRGC